eukprot:13023613-Heterocapsa_arctica.AAC.1
MTNKKSSSASGAQTPRRAVDPLSRRALPGRFASRAKRVQMPAEVKLCQDSRKEGGLCKRADL